MIPLSILDLAPVCEGSDTTAAFANMLELAQHADALGYRRYWLAEHHNMPGIASAATAVLIGHVAGVTRLVDTLHTLRSGEAAGAVPTMPGADRHDPEALAELATLVGAQVLARATAGDPISEQFLDAARARLLGE